MFAVLAEDYHDIAALELLAEREARLRWHRIVAYRHFVPADRRKRQS
jgi:hypothetical protein